MKPNSISGVTCQVADLARASEFYETIGFRAGKAADDRATYYVNWFFVTLVVREGYTPPAEGEGLSVCVKVDDIDEFHAAVVAAGLEPAGEPERQGDTTEFLLRDPDGHNIVFFQKGKKKKA